MDRRIEITGHFINLSELIYKFQEVNCMEEIYLNFKRKVFRISEVSLYGDSRSVYSLTVKPTEKGWKIDVGVTLSYDKDIPYTLTFDPDLKDKVTLKALPWLLIAMEKAKRQSVMEEFFFYKKAIKELEGIYFKIVKQGLSNDSNKIIKGMV